MMIDNFVDRFRVEWSWGGGGDDGIDLVCPWCEWHYEMPWKGSLSDVLTDLDKHMATEHRG